MRLQALTYEDDVSMFLRSLLALLDKTFNVLNLQQGQVAHSVQELCTHTP